MFEYQQEQLNSPDLERLKFNYNIEVTWDNNQWVIKGYEWTFSNLTEVRAFCIKYLSSLTKP